ncbi:tRNA methyltransferase 10 homolog B isoform X2 [Anolis sagrei]|uniref:tRNA methyltransferase 10 homolog B isoform X2 n=1 Tax=Anolis sagrei TaxID=38937 RepID=UPI003520B7CB
MSSSENAAGKSACGGKPDPLQTQGVTCQEDPNGGNLWDTFQLLQIDVGCESSRDQVASNENGCSRNVLRKQRHWEKIVSAKKSKRKLERERRKAKHAEEKGSAQQLSKRELKLIAKERLLSARETGPWLCIDLSMTTNMTHKMDVTPESYLDLFPSETIVYLTPDAENALEEVDPHKVYILGGLVDESIQKSLTLHKAQREHLQTVRLPIQEYMVKNTNAKNYHSTTLAVNQVFDALLCFYATKSWEEALRVAVSPGKGYVLREETI